MTAGRAVLLTATLAIVAASGASHAQGVVSIDNAAVDIQVVQGSDGVAACGVRIRAPHTVGLDAVRTWEVTLYVTDWRVATGIAVDASSYDTSRTAAEPQMRPAPTELAFSVKGNPQVFTATDVRPSHRPGASLALLRDKTAAQVMTAMYTGTPLVMFFRPKNSETEVVIAAGSLKPHAIEGWGKCLQAMQRR